MLYFYSKREISDINFVVHEIHCARNIKLCDKCNEPVIKAEWEQHVSDVHTVVKCKYCGTSATKLDLRNEHRKMSCRECGEKFGKCREDEHMQTKHSDVKCDMCKKSVKKTDLTRHQVSYVTNAVSHCPNRA